MSLTFLDAPTALRRFDAIAVGDAGPHIRGATVDGCWIDYDPIVRRNDYRYGARSVHANTFREAWQREERREQREGERQ